MLFRPSLKGPTVFRRLRVLAAFFVLPIALVFSNPVTASAATSGIWNFTISSGNNVDDPAKCQISWSRNASGAVILGSSSRCDSGGDYTVGYCQAFEGNCGAWALVLKNQASETCGSAPLTPFDIPDNDVGSVAAGLPGAIIDLYWTECIPSQACLSYYFDPNIFTSGLGAQKVDAVQCIGIAVTSPGLPPPVSTASCPFGTPQSALWRHSQVFVDTSGNQYYKDKLGVGFPGRSLTGKSWTTAEREWTLDVLHSVNAVTPTPTNVTLQGKQIPSGSTMQSQATDNTANTFNPVWVNDEYWKNNPSGIAGAHTLPTVTNPMVPYGVQVTTKGSLATANIPLGYSNPEKCTFWLGPRIRVSDHPTFGTATPWGQFRESENVDPEPDPEPPVTVTPVGDQPDSEFGLWDGILSILRRIWNAISGIVGGIKDAIKDLFIPDEGFMDTAFDRTTEQWNDTAVTKFVNAFDFELGSVTGCRGLPLDVELPGGVIINEDIGNACSGSMANTAGIVRNVLNAVLFVGGAIACLRGIGAGFGWRPSIGRSEGA